jgi:hypothetical protein
MEKGEEKEENVTERGRKESKNGKKCWGKKVIERENKGFQRGGVHK